MGEVIEVIRLLSDAGLPIWAIVFGVLGFYMNKKISDLNNSINKYILVTNDRLTRLETLLEEEVRHMNYLERENMR